MGPRRPKGSSGGMNLESKRRKATAGPTGAPAGTCTGSRPELPGNGGSRPGLAWAHRRGSCSHGAVTACSSSSPLVLPDPAWSTAPVPGELPLGLSETFSCGGSGHLASPRKCGVQPSHHTCLIRVSSGWADFYPILTHCPQQKVRGIHGATMDYNRP